MQSKDLTSIMKILLTKSPKNQKTRRKRYKITMILWQHTFRIRWKSLLTKLKWPKTRKFKKSETFKKLNKTLCIKQKIWSTGFRKRKRMLCWAKLLILKEIFSQYSLNMTKSKTWISLLVKFQRISTYINSSSQQSKNFSILSQKASWSL